MNVLRDEKIAFNCSETAQWMEIHIHSNETQFLCRDTQQPMRARHSFAHMHMLLTCRAVVRTPRDAGPFWVPGLIKSIIKCALLWLCSVGHAALHVYVCVRVHLCVFACVVHSPGATARALPPQLGPARPDFAVSLIYHLNNTCLTPN